MFDLHHIRAFVAVAEELNFHRAAERLGTVQPALSRLVRNLEDDLKVQLLERTTRHVQLTEAGKSFLAEARTLTGQLASAVRTARETHSGTAGSLTVAYMDFAVSRILPDFLSALWGSGDAIRVDLKYMSTAQQRLSLMEGKIDLGFMIGQMSGLHLDSLLIAEEQIMVAMSAQHPLAGKRVVTCRDIAGEPVLLGGEAEWSAFREILFEIWSSEGINPRVVLEATSAAALFGLTAKGVGISFYAGKPSVYHTKDMAFARLKSSRKVPIALVWRKGAKLPLITTVLKLAGLVR